jgi:hypothetical protein
MPSVVGLLTYLTPVSRTIQLLVLAAQDLFAR